MGEAIGIGNPGQFEHALKITVLGIGNGNVRLGFEADASVAIHRWEVWQRIHGMTEVSVPIEDLEPTVVH